MAKTVATIAFIAVVAIAGLVIGTRRTVADGRVFAADLAKANPAFEQIQCDREIPIDADGARFRCTFTSAASVVEIEYTMDRTGKTTDRQIRNTPTP
jgi:hypothetical protein